jgi:hypothetical protein
VWRQKHIDWVKALKDIGYKQRAGSSGILRFSRDGSFTLIYTVIYQSPHYESLSQGDSWTIYFGTWKQNGDFIDVTYSLKYQDISVVGSDGKEICPPASETKQIRIRGRNLGFEDVVYIRSPRLEIGVNKTFSVPPGVPEFVCPQKTVVAH